MNILCSLWFSLVSCLLLFGCILQTFLVVLPCVAHLRCFSNHIVRTLFVCHLELVQRIQTAHLRRNKPRNGIATASNQHSYKRRSPNLRHLTLFLLSVLVSTFFPFLSVLGPSITPGTGMSRHRYEIVINGSFTFFGGYFAPMNYS